MIRRGLQELVRSPLSFLEVIAADYFWKKINKNQSLLASSLQTAYNLSALPNLVASLVQDLIEAVESRIKNAFDISGLARDAMTRAGGLISWVFPKSKGGKVRVEISCL